MEQGIEFSDEALNRAVLRMSAKIHEQGDFNCACCAKTKKSEFLYSIGTLVPDGSVITRAGEKKRIVIFAVCGLCGKMDPEKMRLRSEANIEASGMLLDSEYHPPE